MMKTLITSSLLLSVLSPFAFSQETGLTAAIAQLPPCALSCLTTAIIQSPCELTDQICICTNAKLQASVEECVIRSCTMKQALTTKNVTATTCNAPIRSKTESLRITNITLGVISAACVLMRITYKAVFSLAELGWDDYLVLATLISGVPSTIITDRGTTVNGLGKDIWTLPFSNITNFIRWFYVMEVLYFFQLTLLKLALLFFFLRIFPAREMKRLIWGTIAFVIMFGTSFVFAGIFQCRPINFYWNRWDGEHAGKCLDINALGWANAAISIALDVWMLGLPLSQVFHLKLAWKKKVGVTLMFFVGTFVTVVSILRLQSLVHFANSTNPTFDQVELSSWSTIEINVGIMCACMPALRVILVHIFPKVLGTTRGSSNQYYAKYGHHPATKSGNNSNVMGSRMGREQGPPGRDKNGITYTKTFEVQHGDDEEQLVRMDDLSGKGTRVRSSGSSEASVSAAISPLPLPTSPAGPRV